MDHIYIDSTKAFDPSGFDENKRGGKGTSHRPNVPLQPSLRRQRTRSTLKQTPCPPVKPSSCCSLLDSAFCVRQVGDETLDDLWEMCITALCPVFIVKARLLLLYQTHMGGMSIEGLETTNLNQENLKQ